VSAASLTVLRMTVVVTAVVAAALLYPTTGRTQIRKIGDEFLVNSYTTGAQVVPVVATRGDDEFIVLWSGGNPIRSLLFGVRAQRFHQTGEALGSEFLISAQATTDDNVERHPAIAARSDGSLG